MICEMIARVRMLVVALALAIGLGACFGKGAQTPQDVARGGVATIAEAVKVADATCAAVVRNRAVPQSAAIDIGAKCQLGYALARLSLVAADRAIDSWNATSAGQIACAAAKAVEGLAMIESGLELAGVPVPKEVSDAFTAATVLAAGTDAKVCKPAGAPAATSVSPAAEPAPNTTI